MPKVLHIGPCDSPGGMANVMHILAEHPPEGWQADLLASHVVGSPWAKWRAYRKARHTLIQMLEHPERRPDVVHLHTAADWSWWRKRRFARLANKAGVPNIIHIHSGRFDSWLADSKSNHRSFVSSITKYDSRVVVLSPDWKEVLSNMIGPVKVINNPISPNIQCDPSVTRDVNHLLLLGRNDPVKGHQFAIEFTRELRKIYPDARLTLTGVEQADDPWVDAKGWVSEKEKLTLLQKSTVVIVPSRYEGQPLVALEALATNCPVITSDTVHSLPPSVLIAEFGNVESWIEAYRSLSDSDVRGSVRTFEVESVKNQWSQYYSEILSANIRAV